MIKIHRILLSVFTVFAAIFLGWLGLNSVAAQHEPSTSPYIIKTDANGLDISVHLKDFQVEKVQLNGTAYDVLSFAGQNGKIHEPGAPELPVLDLIIGIPAGGEASLEIQSLETQALPERYALAPAPAPLPLEEDLTPGKMTRANGFSDTDSLSDYYPYTPALIAGEAWVRGQRVIRLQISPFQYNPASQSTTFHPEFNLRINFSNPTPSECTDCSYEDEMESVLQQQLVNYDQSRNWRIEPGSSEMLAQIQSPLVTSFLGPRFEFVVDQDGVYHVSYAELQAAGMDVENVDPQTFKVFNHGTEIDILVFGENDGSFDDGDYIVFYGEKFRGEIMEARYESSMTKAGNIPNNPSYAANNWFWQCLQSCELASYFERYTDDNVYYLTTGGSNGLRMAAQSGTPGEAAVPDHFFTTIRAEESNQVWLNEFHDDDIWFWKQIKPGQFFIPFNGITESYTTTFPTTLQALAAGVYSATVHLEFITRSHNPSASGDYHTQVLINGNLIADNYWDGKNRFNIDTEIPHSYLQDGSNDLDLAMLETSFIAQDLSLDFYEITYARNFTAANDQLTFSYELPGDWRFQITGLVSDTAEAYDISDPMKPKVISGTSVTGSPSNYTAAFQVTTGTDAKFVVAGHASGVLTPKKLAAYTPPNFAAMPEADYILITHANFLTSTQTLADYRAAQGHTVAVINVSDLYHEFNDGIYHPIAIKNFLAYAFANWSSPPVYVTLVGNGNWNMKNYGDGSKSYHNAPPTYMPPNLAYVDPWQGEVDSANLLATVIGDDTIPDVHIARIPVNTDAQMAIYVGKVIGYESTGLQEWQKNILFIADNVPDPDFAGDFVGFSEAIISDYVDPTFPYRPLRIYEDTGIFSTTIYAGIPDFDCKSRPSSECDDVTYAITNTMNITGALIVNYTGHASLNRWSGESIFLTSDMNTLDNAGQLPFILSMDCLDGHWTFPNLPSLAYRFITDEGRGAIATYSPTGLGVATGHDYIQRGFYETMFENDNWEIGAAATAGKFTLWGNGFSYDLMHTYILFGDPALKLINNSIENTFLPAIINP